MKNRFAFLLFCISLVNYTFPEIILETWGNPFKEINISTVIKTLFPMNYCKSSRIFILLSLGENIDEIENNKALLTDSSTSLLLGSPYQGGIIAYILKPCDHGYDAKITHGIIAAEFDQSKKIQWYTGNATIIKETGTRIGMGSSNTNKIVAIQGSGTYAAKLCYDLILGGYSDWYLPSRDELEKLYENKSVIGKFDLNAYWSSSEFNNNYALDLHFYDGDQAYNLKSSYGFVRAIRYF